MRLPRFEYVKASTTGEALAALQAGDGQTRILAGGTDLLVNMKYRIERPATVIGIRTIDELCSVTTGSDGSLHLGAGVTLSSLAENSLIKESCPGLGRAITAVGSKHIRNMGTIGGNACLNTRCWYYNQSQLWRDAREVCRKAGGNVCHAINGSERCHAINSSDTAPMLVALDAEMVIQNREGERRVLAREFYRNDGVRYNALEPEEMLSRIEIPRGNTERRTAFIKICSRRGLDFAMANIGAAVSVKAGRCSQVRIVIGAIASHPLILEKTAAVVEEGGLSEGGMEQAADTARTELGTLTNLFSSAGYKRQLAQVLVKRVLQELKGSSRNKRRAGK